MNEIIIRNGRKSDKLRLSIRYLVIWFLLFIRIPLCDDYVMFVGKKNKNKFPLKHTINFINSQLEDVCFFFFLEINFIEIKMQLFWLDKVSEKKKLEKKSIFKQSSESWIMNFGSWLVILHTKQLTVFKLTILEKTEEKTLWLNFEQPEKKNIQNLRLIFFGSIFNQ